MRETIVLHEEMQLTLYSVNRAPYQTLALRELTLPTWVLSFVQSGDLVTSASGEHWRVEAGQVMLHPPALPFDEIAARSGVHLWFAFAANIGPHMELFRLHPVYPVVHIMDAARYIQVFDKLLAVWTGPEVATRSFRLVTLTLTLFDLILESWQQMGSLPRPAAMQTNADRFSDVIRYMTEHLAEKLSRQELAALAHLHPAYFDQLFRKTYGVPPMQMLRDLRLRHAQKLLQGTDAPLATLAGWCGLGDAAYFSRVFQAQFGQTPGAYRKAIKSTTTAYIPTLPEAPDTP